METQPESQLNQETANPRHVPGIRWWICIFLFFATVLSYMDRSVIGMVKSDLQHDLGWNEIDYGNVVAMFSLAYALGYLFAGRLIDIIGVRLGLALCVGLWSLSAMGHAIARTVHQFMFARFGLGLAEGGTFPACIKSVAEWFPRKERSLATGFFNAGSNIGAVVTPVVVAIITMRYKWPWCFIFTGAAGLVWLVFWLWKYRPPEKNPAVSPQELQYIQSDPPDPPGRISWIGILRYRATWAFIVGTSLTSPIFWFYLYWLPDFLSKNFHLDKTQMQLPLITVYLMADVGSVLAGLFSTMLIKRGWSLNFSRKIGLFSVACFALPVYLAPYQGMWGATWLIAFAAFAHQGFVANLFPLVGDMMPRRAISSVVGVGGMAAGFVAMGFQSFSGHLLQWYGNGAYPILFGIASITYVSTTLFIHLLVPRLEVVKLPEEPRGFDVVMKA